MKCTNYIYVIFLACTLSSCKIASYFQNSVNTPCFNDENKYQINAGYCNRNYVAQIAANPYKGISILANSGFSEKQNNTDLSIGYNLRGKHPFGIEGFVGYGYGETYYTSTKTDYDIIWQSSTSYYYSIKNKFDKYLGQIDLYYYSEDNLQLCIFGRYSYMNFRSYNLAITASNDSTGRQRNYTNLTTGIFDVGFAFKYQVKHIGMFLQGSYTTHTTSINTLPGIYFQKRLPMFFGAGLTFYFKSFRKNSKTKN